MTDGSDVFTGQRMVPVSERLAVIDTLRAVALFGVIVMNLVAMVMIFKAPSVMSTATPLDMGIGLFELVFIQGKARSAFAFLFGVGFGILMQRAQARGAGFGAFYLQRTGILLVIGVCNLAFLYWGDILIVYALLGMVLLLFRNAGQRLLLTLGLALTIIPPLVAGVVEAMTGAPLGNLAGLSPADVEAAFVALAPAYTDGSYVDFIGANLRYYRLHNVSETGPVIVYNLGVLGLFMLGLWSTRRGLFEDIERHRPLLRRIAWIALPLGLLFSAAFATRRLGIPTEGVAYGVVTAGYLGLPVMAFGYLAILTLYISRKGRWLSTLFAPMGRMALTGYLASNGIGAFVWYSWGLNRINDPAWLNMIVMSLLVIAVFAGLSLFSALWLRVFRFGPAEWLWRSLTYGQFQPLLKQAGGPRNQIPAA